MEYRALAIGIQHELYEYLKTYLMDIDTDLIYALTVTQGIRLFAEQPCHLILIALQCVKGSRLDLLTGLRKARFMPILALIDQETVEEAARMLDCGVDLCMPENTSPLLIRKYAKSLIRRYTVYNHYAQPEALEAVPFRCGDIYIDPIRRAVQVRNEFIELRPREFSLLLYFMQNPGIALTTEQIRDHAWGQDGGHEYSVGQAVSELRKQIEHDPVKPVHILTIYRVGYRFVAYAGETCDRQ